MATREEIKGSALYFFAYKGYEATTMEEIAGAVGLKKQSLYSHFSGKQELYACVLGDQNMQIAVELNNVIERLKDEPAQILLQGVFLSMVRIFAARERLLLWKRAFIHYGCKDTEKAGDISEWHFDDKLKNMLFEMMEKRYPRLHEPNVFKSLFRSYMLTVQGYFDWMIVVGHDEEVWQDIWDNFWNGISRYFVC